MKQIFFTLKYKPHVLVRFLFMLLLSSNSLLSFAQGDSLETCSGCSCEKDLTPSGVMISHVHKKGEWMFSYRFMAMNMNGMQLGTSELNDEEVFLKYLMSSHTMRMDMHMLMGMYGVTSKLTVMAMLHYNVVSMDMAMLPGTSHNHVMEGMAEEEKPMDMNMKTAGIGDTKVHLLYSLFHSPSHYLLASVGVSIPTGDIQQKGKGNSMYASKRLPYAMQLGSGTWDLLPCISYLYQSGRIAWSTQVTSTLRTGYNSVSYKLGNDYTSNTWFSFLWLGTLATSVRLEASTTDHLHGRDKALYAYNEPSAHPLNYGGQRATGFLGASYLFKRSILNGNKLGVEYGIPLYQKVNGTQMPLRFSINASWSYVF